jgi:hypothetical protein
MQIICSNDNNNRRIHNGHQQFLSPNSFALKCNVWINIYIRVMCFVWHVMCDVFFEFFTLRWSVITLKWERGVLAICAGAASAVAIVTVVNAITIINQHIPKRSVCESRPYTKYWRIQIMNPGTSVFDNRIIRWIRAFKRCWGSRRAFANVRPGMIHQLDHQVCWKISVTRLFSI